jgi:hypothetical protein
MKQGKLDDGGKILDAEWWMLDNLYILYILYQIISPTMHPASSIQHPVSGIHHPTVKNPP